MKIVFFDGYCSLCNALVDWLMRIDKRGHLKFASLQGTTASELLQKEQAPGDCDTIIYLRDKESFERSTAVLQILSDIGGVWQSAEILLLLPKTLRDVAYRIVAKNRYRIFGKRETCRVPTPQERDRLLP